MKKLYKINKHNSTVCGLPGRDFDWTLFDWDSLTEHDCGNERYSTECEHEGKRGQLIGVLKAPPVYVDDGLIAPNCQYLHVPYNWTENGTTYRVRPNDAMYAGETYLGKLIKAQRAIKKPDGCWYWELEFDEGGE